MDWNGISILRKQRLYLVLPRVQSGRGCFHTQTLSSQYPKLHWPGTVAQKVILMYFYSVRYCRRLYWLWLGCFTAASIMLCSRSVTKTVLIAYQLLLNSDCIKAFSVFHSAPSVSRLGLGKMSGEDGAGTVDHNWPCHSLPYNVVLSNKIRGFGPSNVATV